MSEARTIYELRSLITTNVSGFVDGMNRAAGATRNLSASWLNAANAIGTAAGRVAAVVGGAMTGVAVAAGRSATAFLSMREQAEIAFGTVLKSSGAARALTKDLEQLAERTPFETKDLIAGAQTLLAFKFQANELIPILTKLSDAVSMKGASPEALQRIVLVLGQIQAKGRLQGEELLQLNELGLNPRDMLAKAMGATAEELPKLIEKGAISSKVAIKAILDEIDANFQGLSDKQSRTFGGLLSTLSDTASRVSAQVMLPAFNAMKTGLEQFLAFIGSTEAAKAMEPLRDAVGRASAAVAELIKATGGDIFRSFIASMKAGADAVASMAEWLNKNSDAVGKAATDWGRFLGGIAKLVADYPTVVATLTGLTVTGFLGLNNAVIATGKALIDTIKQLVQFSTVATTTQAATATTTTAVSGLTSSVVTLAAKLAIAVTAAVALGAAFYQMHPDIKAVNRELAKSAELRDKTGKAVGATNNQQLDDAAAIKDPAQRAAALERMLATADKNVAFSAAEKERTAKAAGDSSGVLDMLGMDPAAAQARDAAKDAEANAERHKAYRDAIAAMLEQERQAIANAADDAALEATNKPEAGPAAIPRSAEIDKAIASQEMKRRTGTFGSELPSITEFLSQAGVTGEDVAKLATSYGASDAQAGTLGDMFAGAGGDPEQIQRVAEAFAGLVEQLEQMPTEADLAKEALAQAEWAEQRRADALQASAEASRESLSVIDEITSEYGASGDAVDAYNERLNELNDKLNSGELSVADFGKAVGDLNRETLQGAAAAKQQRILAGKPNQADINQALDQRRKQAANRQFDDQVDMLAQRMGIMPAGNGQQQQQGQQRGGFNPAVAGAMQFTQMIMPAFGQVGNAAMGFANQLTNLFNPMQQFGNNLQQMNEATQRQIAEAAGKVEDFLASDSGRAGSLSAQIEQLRVERSFKTPGGDRFNELTAQIEALTRDLQMMLNPPAYSTASLDQANIFRDPTTNIDRANIQIQLPNVRDLTQADINVIAQRIRDELARAGRIV